MHIKNGQVETLREPRPEDTSTAPNRALRRAMERQQRTAKPSPIVAGGMRAPTDERTRATSRGAVRMHVRGRR